RAQGSRPDPPRRRREKPRGAVPHGIAARPRTRRGKEQRQGGRVAAQGRGAKAAASGVFPRPGVREGRLRPAARPQGSHQVDAARRAAGLRRRRVLARPRLRRRRRRRARSAAGPGLAAARGAARPCPGDGIRAAHRATDQAAVTGESRALYLRLLTYVRPHWRIFVLAVVGMVLAAATEPLLPALIKPLLDGGFGARGAPARTPALFAGALIGVFALRGILTFFSSYCLQWVGHRLVLELRGAMFARLVRFPARFFDEQSSGVVLSKVAYDVAGVTGSATTVLTVAVKDTIAIIGLLGFMFS